MSQPLYYTTHDSTMGCLLLVAGMRGLCYLTLLKDKREAAAHLAQKYAVAPLPAPMEFEGFFTTTKRAIDHYLNDGAKLSLAYDIVEGSALQRAVWLEIAKIPYGQTISYSTLAERVGFPRAVRAVASACGANPVPLAIPCHRIIAKDGALGGFSLGGVSVKEKLLKIERSDPKSMESRTTTGLSAA